MPPADSPKDLRRAYEELAARFQQRTAELERSNAALQESEQRFRVALVADGLVESFDNIYQQHEMETYFEVRAISETVGVCKPAGEMFKTAMEKMNLEEADKKYIIMIGNNLERDIVGANRMGITSVLAGYSPRYRMKPENEEETPDYVVCDPSEIPALIEMLDKQMENKKQLGW